MEPKRIKFIYIFKSLNFVKIVIVTKVCSYGLVRIFVIARYVSIVAHLGSAVALASLKEFNSEKQDNNLGYFFPS